VLSECYRLRWRIKQAFDQPEQKLDERQAWGKSNTVKTGSSEKFVPDRHSAPSPPLKRGSP
jgi:hypothetical protein